MQVRSVWRLWPKHRKDFLHLVVIAVVLRTRLLNVRGVLSSGIGVDGHRHLILRDGDGGPSGSDDVRHMASSSIVTSNEWTSNVQSVPSAQSVQQKPWVLILEEHGHPSFRFLHGVLVYMLCFRRLGYCILSISCFCSCNWFFCSDN